MKKIKDYVSYESNPVTFLLWWNSKQFVKVARLLFDKTYRPEKFY